MLNRKTERGQIVNNKKHDTGSYIYILIIFILQTFTATSQPIITSFSPETGSIGTLVTLLGSNFNTTTTNNIVYFNGIRASVTVASSNSITVIVPSGATYGPISITTNNLTAYTTKNYMVTFPGCAGISSSSFSIPKNFTSVNNSIDINSADFDADGKPDIISNGSDVSTISIHRNLSTAGFLQLGDKIDLATDYYPIRSVTGDINGDGKTDLVVANKSSFRLTLFLNTSVPGVISFAPRIDVFIGSATSDITIRDLDLDGKPDIALANESNPSLSILRNTSSIVGVSFAPRIDFATSGLFSFGVETEDINEDGKSDIILVSSNSSYDSVFVFMNTSVAGSIGLAPKISLHNNSGGKDIKVADLDLDNKPDIITVNATSNTISIFRNTSASGTISFQPRINFTTGTMPQRISVADLDGDGKPDLGIQNRNSGNISTFRNLSSPGLIQLSSKIDFNSNPNISSLSIADIDIDGKPDFITTNNPGNTISIMRKPLSQRIFLVDSSKINNSLAVGLCEVNGASWETATSSLQNAIDNAIEGDEIWIAKGIYFPTKDRYGNPIPADLKSRTINIKNRVKLYGGFSGSETEKSQRAPHLNLTILDGIVNGNNVYNVVSFFQADDYTLLEGVTIRHGSATGTSPGGGIIIHTSSPVINNVRIIENNSSTYGGAIYSYLSAPTLINCLLTNNSAYAGAGFTGDSSEISIINCNIFSNNASYGGGGIFSRRSAKFNIVNSIIWGNSSTSFEVDNIMDSSGFILASYSIVGQVGGVYPGVSNQNINPLFADAANDNFALINSSWAINKGNLSAYPIFGASNDLVGNPRVQNNFISVGAFQQSAFPFLNSARILFVDSTATEKYGNGNSWNSAFKNLSDAILVANANDIVSEIWVARGTYKPNYNRSGVYPVDGNWRKKTFVLKNAVRVLGGFAGTELTLSERSLTNNISILDGKFMTAQGFESNVEHVVYLQHTDSLATLDGFTIKNGVGESGAGIYADTAMSAIKNCTITENRGSEGVGLYAILSNLLIDNCTFTNNLGTSGAGITNVISNPKIQNCLFQGNSYISNNYSKAGAIMNIRSSPLIINCDFINNRALNIGGAISNSSYSEPQIINCRFIGNICMNEEQTYGGNGGAICNEGLCKLVIMNSVFTKNKAGSAGAMFSYQDTVTLINCTITNNSANYTGGLNQGSYSYTNIHNSIIWGNTEVFGDGTGNSANIYNDLYIVPSSYPASHSIIGIPAGVWPGTENLNVNPLFLDTANANFNVFSNSPVIDKGNNGLYTGNLAKDLDIYNEPRLSGNMIDIGAAEYSLKICPSLGSNSITSGLIGNSYQWQVNKGNGFEVIFDNSNYSGTSTGTLQLNNPPSNFYGYQYRCLVDGNFSNTVFLRVQNRWTGSVSQAWENPLNWSCGVVPDINSDVLIESGSVIINSNVSIRKLLIRPGVMFTINQPYTLNVLY